jgi:hypothetical protein
LERLRLRARCLPGDANAGPATQEADHGDEILSERDVLAVIERGER